MKNRSTTIPAAALLLTAVAFIHGTAFAATPILEYTFNGGLDSSGSVTSALTLQNSAVRGSSGGVTGSVGDGVLDLTAALGMGNLASPATNAPRASLATRPVEVNALTSFTVQGWFKTDGSLIAGNANIFTVNGNMSLIATASGQISLNVDGTSKQSGTGGYNTNSVWTFFAVTYDGTVSATPNVKFYVGNTSTGVSQLGTTITLDSGTVGGTSGILAIGNSAGGDRGFDGYLDNIRFFGSASSMSADGVLSLSELEAIRVSDTSIPEPSSYALILGGVAVLGVCVRRRPRQTVSLR